MNEPRGPLLTLPVHEALLRARDAGAPALDCTLDLGRTTSRVETGTEHWQWNGRAYAYAESCKDRTIYYWDEDRFAPAARFANSLIKLVPTEWGAPTFEIDGIKKLPPAQVSPYDDATRTERKNVGEGKRVAV